MNVPRSALALGAVAGLAASLTFVAGFVAGTTVERQQAATSGDLSDPNLRDFLTAYHLVTQQSYFRPFNKHQLVYAAIDGMMNATGDPHTIFLSPPQNHSADQQLNGSRFSGIGAIVVPDGRLLEVLAVIPGAPAERAHLHSGDLITRIDGKSVEGFTSDQAIALIHGQAGTIVHLDIRRGGQSLSAVPVTRAAIAPITAYSRLLPHHIGYLQILSFGDGTAAEVREGLRILSGQHMRSLVLDLRGNPGGYVEAAQKIVSDFLSGGVVAYEQSNKQQRVPLTVISGQRIIRVPVAVLVDTNTASAAEITAAALRDEDGAVLIGTRTYGKGSMQSVYSLADGSTVRVTDRLWLTPKLHSIGNVGLKPDIFVPSSGAVQGTDGDLQLRAAERYLLQHRG